VLYDSGCTLVKSAFGTAGVVGATPSPTTILWAGALAGFVQGTVTFSSGINNGVSATVKAVNPGIGFVLSYPLANAPATGDTFTIYQGCDHTQNTCQFKFNNLVNFRGFPYVPQATYAI
jgi:uncharacterized phage protein (TIGR02218 family)